MPSFADEMRGRLPETLHLPDEFAALFDWIEARGQLYPSQRVAGDRFGTIQPLNGGEPGTIILFRVEHPEETQAFCQAWFGVDGLHKRLVPFARTGADGSQAAFWRDDEGRQQIVHLGSEGLASLFAPSPLDFLRLLAIGYTELSGDCMDDVHAEPERPAEGTPYRQWLVDTYGVAIPRVAAAILGEQPDLFADTSADPFRRWVASMTR